RRPRLLRGEHAHPDRGESPVPLAGGVAARAGRGVPGRAHGRDRVHHDHDRRERRDRRRGRLLRRHDTDPRPASIAAHLPAIQANIDEIVRRLQAKAPGVPIIGSTYYNPLLGAWVLVPGPVGQVLSHASVAPVELLNSGLTAAYAADGATVADLYGAFES